MLLTSTVLLFMMAGTCLAATDPVYVHDQIILRAADGGLISSAGGLRQAFSAKETCGACHSYDDIERHSYHAQLGANELVGWATYNAAATGPFAGFRKGLAPKGKNWVQGLGHFGKW